MNRYLINVAGCIEPEATRSRKAREVEAENCETDALLWADVKGGKLEVGAYSPGFFEAGAKSPK